MLDVNEFFLGDSTKWKSNGEDLIMKKYALTGQ